MGRDFFSGNGFFNKNVMFVVQYKSFATCISRAPIQFYKEIITHYFKQVFDY